VDNDSALPEDATVDKSYLALTYPLKKDESATTSEDGASGRNVSVQRVDDIEFFDLVAQVCRLGHSDESHDFAPQVTSTPVASCIEEENLIFFGELEINVSRSDMQRCLIKGAALDLVPGLIVFLYFPFSVRKQSTDRKKGETIKLHRNAFHDK